MLRVYEILECLTTSSRIYNCALSCGVGVGIVVFGMVLRTQPWQVIYWICTALTGTLTVLIFFTLPETAFNRSSAVVTRAKSRAETRPKTNITAAKSVKLEDDTEGQGAQEVEITTTEPESSSRLAKRTWIQSLRIFGPILTDESLGLLILRPIVCLALPGVLWATLINSVTIGMIVVVSSNFSTAFHEVYGFESWQSGLTFVSTIIGSLIAIFAGGHFSDWIADKFTQRNNGIRVPEMRLPSLAISVITGPLACILYGVGIGKRLHWMCAVVGIGLGKLSKIPRSL